MVGEKGGKRYHYKIAEKLEHNIKEILVLLLESKGIRKQDIEKIMGEK